MQVSFSVNEPEITVFNNVEFNRKIEEKRWQVPRRNLNAADIQKCT